MPLVFHRLWDNNIASIISIKIITPLISDFQFSLVVSKIVIDGYAIWVCYFDVVGVAFTPPMLMSAASRTANFKFFIKF